MTKKVAPEHKLWNPRSQRICKAASHNYTQPITEVSGGVEIVRAYICSRCGNAVRISFEQDKETA